MNTKGLTTKLKSILTGPIKKTFLNSLIIAPLTIIFAVVMTAIMGAITTNIPPLYSVAATAIAAGAFLITALELHKGKEDFLYLLPTMLFAMGWLMLAASFGIPVMNLNVNITEPVGFALISSVILFARFTMNSVLKMKLA